jgi:hypothetical protein
VATRRHVLLWQLHAETADEISELQDCWIEDWLEEQSAPRVVFTSDLATALHVLEQELTARGLSLTTH